MLYVSHTVKGIVRVHAETVAFMIGARAGGQSAAVSSPAGNSVDRSSASLVKILEGALRAVETRGVHRLTMRDISEASRVSRATLYRNFSTKDEVLAAVTEYICVNFEEGVRAAAAAHPDPMDRFRAVMQFFSQYARDRSPEPMLEIEPGFYLRFFRSHFGRHKAAVGAALALTFDHFEAAIGTPIDRMGVAEALIRMQLSTLMVPAEDDWLAIWNDSPASVARLLALIRPS